MDKRGGDLDRDVRRRLDGSSFLTRAIACSIVSISVKVFPPWRRAPG
jgi:hypothetical protein